MCQLGRQLFGLEGVVGTQLACQFEAAFFHIYDGHRGCARALHGLQHQQPHRTCTKDEHVVPALDLHLLETPGNASQRLQKRGFGEAQVADRVDRAVRRDNVLGKRARAGHADHAQIQTLIELAALTKVATVTRQIGVSGNAVADLKSFDLITNCRHLAAEFVSGYERVLRQRVAAVPDVHVGSTNARVFHVNNNLAGSGFGDTDVDNVRFFGLEYLRRNHKYSFIAVSFY